MRRPPLRDLGFLLPFFLVGGIFAVVHWTGRLQGIGVAVAFVLLPILDKVIGLDTRNLTSDEERALENHGYYRALLHAWAVMQLSLVLLGFVAVARADVPVWVAALLAVPLGLMNGGIGITVAHELGHRNNVLDRMAARVLLVTVCYGHFTIEHNRGHHVRVATPEDPATARMGESFYRFLLRTVPAQWMSAWRLENARCRRAHGRALTVFNEMVWLTAASCALAAASFAAGGPALLVYFLAQSAFAATLLEAVNYVEHYGLLRRTVDGPAAAPRTYEPVTPRHSWNASHAVTNKLLFSLQRHSDHHAFAGRRYQLLRHIADAPQLPGGYPTMILLALVPPLWFHVMNPRARAAQKVPP